MFRKLQKYISLDQLKGATVSLWGLSFKPNTDDMREAPSVVLANALLAVGCKVKVYDPIAMEEAHKQLGDTVYYTSAYVVIFCTFCSWTPFTRYGEICDRSARLYLSGLSWGLILASSSSVLTDSDNIAIRI